MADIFLSYATEDRERVRPLVECLEEHGWSVWWDREIPVSREWSDVIEEAIENSRTVVVVWTKASVASEWVKLEAREGKSRPGGLIPVRLDDVKLRMEFRGPQNADLTDWDGSVSHPELQATFSALGATLGVPTRAAEPVVEREALPTDPPLGAADVGGASPPVLEVPSVQAAAPNDQGDAPSPSIKPIGPVAPSIPATAVGKDRPSAWGERWPRVATGAATGLAGGVFAAISEILIYANDPRTGSGSILPLWQTAVGGGAVAGVIWAVAGVVAGPRRPALVSALILSFVVLAGWIGVMGTYQDVMAAGIIIGWPTGGVVGSWIGVEVVKFRAGRNSYWTSRRPRLITGLGTGLAGGLLAGILEVLIYADDSSSGSVASADLSFALFGAVFAGSIWACAGAVAGPHWRPLSGAVALSLIVLAGWVSYFGTYDDVVSAAVLIGWPLGGTVGAWLVNVIDTR